MIITNKEKDFSKNLEICSTKTKSRVYTLLFLFKIRIKYVIILYSCKLKFLYDWRFYG